MTTRPVSRLRVTIGNRLERLLDALAGIVAEPLASPLTPEVIVVPSQGMGRWVSQELARRLGAWMNGRLVLPNAYLDELFRALPGGAARGAWDPAALRWRVMGLLPPCLAREGFEAPRRYLAGEARQLKLYQLAGKIAEVFDGYALFRPEMALAWERGQGGDAADAAGWQVELWRLLAAVDPHHRAALRRAFLERIRDPGFALPPGALPERVSVFGVSALPPFHLEALAALGERTEVHLFLASPCREYWADIVPGRVVSRRDREAGRGAHHWEEGNRLLASLGKAGRDFFGFVQELPAQPREDWVEPGEDTLLQCLQSDILHLRDRRGAGRRRLGSNDDSLRLHACHGALREVEVLRDRLLDLFDRDARLEPRHVVVMTPDLEAYAPFVEAVFDGPGSPRIPFALADRTARGGSPLADAFLRVLALVGGRFGAARVLDLLEAPSVRRRFGFSTADVERAHAWVQETRVRWGADGENRRALGLPAFEENTWRAGLDRLLLGYAFPGGGARFFEGVLPYDDLEGGDDAQALGRLAEFTERLFIGVRSLEAPRDLGSWAEDLGALFDALFEAADGEEREERLVRRAFEGLAEAGALSGYGEPVDLEVVAASLGASLEAEPFGGGFLSGGVTFCALRPLRSIPFPVVCLLGMNDGAFPRATRPLGFDLTAAEPRPGDRSPRHEDRYAFLEALLAARRHLHVSYVGQSVRDGSDVPPSVVVSELLDAIDEGFAPAGGGPPAPGWAREHLVVRHRLQAFSPAYFQPPSQGSPLAPCPLFSYSSENARASRHLAPGAPRRTQGLFLTCLPEPPEELRRVDLGDLVRFFSNPARYLFAVRLGLRLEGDDAVVEEREPFDVAGLERYDLEQRLLAAALAGSDLDQALPAARARGVLPHGRVGEGAFGDLRAEVEAFGDEIRPCLEGRPLEPVTFEREVSGFTLSGRLEGLRCDRLVQFRPATVKARDRLRLWVHHLALNLVAEEGLPRSSLLVGKGEVVGLPPLEAAAERLRDLLDLYWEGLGRLLPFFPRASWAYAQRLGKDGDRWAARKAARSEWEGDFRKDPEAGDPHFARAFGREDPLGAEFEALAGRVFGPLLEAVELAEAGEPEGGP
ncbi:MAG: exodeoxyribonuclease V subunit gamma [Deltaproteobacteria bacterium]|nr:exodeoxyribonuclease V subunit gamma [Deltaproteobacteria bacterium]